MEKINLEKVNGRYLITDECKPIYKIGGVRAKYSVPYQNKQLEPAIAKRNYVPCEDLMELYYYVLCETLVEKGLTWAPKCNEVALATINDNNSTMEKNAVISDNVFNYLASDNLVDIIDLSQIINKLCNRKYATEIKSITTPLVRDNPEPHNIQEYLTLLNYFKKITETENKNNHSTKLEIDGRIGVYLNALAMIDLFTMQNDRNYGNIFFTTKEKNNIMTVQLAPLIDNGLACGIFKNPNSDSPFKRAIKYLDENTSTSPDTSYKFFDIFDATYLRFGYTPQRTDDDNIKIAISKGKSLAKIELSLMYDDVRNAILKNPNIENMYTTLSGIDPKLIIERILDTNRGLVKKDVTDIKDMGKTLKGLSELTQAVIEK